MRWSAEHAGLGRRRWTSRSMTGQCRGLIPVAGGFAAAAHKHFDFHFKLLISNLASRPPFSSAAAAPAQPGKENASHAPSRWPQYAMATIADQVGDTDRVGGQADVAMRLATFSGPHTESSRPGNRASTSSSRSDT